MLRVNQALDLYDPQILFFLTESSSYKPKVLLTLDTILTQKGRITQLFFAPSPKKKAKA